MNHSGKPFLLAFSLKLTGRIEESKDDYLGVIFNLFNKSFSEDIRDKTILICFFDMNQRPSRNCLLQLSRRAKELKAKDVVVVAIQASKVDEAKLNDWEQKNTIHFPVGMVQGDEEKTRFTWGVRSLPWLILTDSKHVVTAEGFALTELDEKLNGNSH